VGRPAFSRGRGPYVALTHASCPSRHYRFDHATPVYSCPLALHDWRNRAEINEITETIIGPPIAVHRDLGPGLLESAYQTCLLYKLVQRGLRVETEMAMSVMYKGNVLAITSDSSSTSTFDCSATVFADWSSTSRK
jgi:hypothetical protein